MRQERLKDKREKANNQNDAEAVEDVIENDLADASGKGTNSAKANARAEKNERDRDINLVRVATENISHSTQPGGRRGSKLGNSAINADQASVYAERNKSTQP